MGFTQAVRSVLFENYANFKGRACRSEFWWFQLFALIFLIVFGILFAIGIGVDEKLQLNNVLVIGIGVVAGLVWLAMFIPVLALQVRRFHDRDFSGWWYLGVFFVSFIPLIGPVVGIGLLIFDAMKGTDGPNRFGPDPLRPNVTSDIFA